MTEAERPPGEESRWDRLWRCFHRLHDLDADARLGALAALRDEDPGLAGEVEDLLARSGGDGSLLDSSRGLLGRALGELETAASTPEEAWIGRRVGPYRLTRKLGEGGMGVVFLADRADGAVEQRVAVKFLSTLAAPASVVERFRREREILARLDHPSIARLIDVGDHPDGGPYVVMEFVEGEPIDRWCEQRNLGLEARLELMIAVCEAVDVAHRHLVVHRDLKPSNVLVTREGEPRLVDFGIARRLDLGDETLGTSPALTPRWASPEQLAGEPVTTGSDLYALGLLLCHLLTGRLPYRESDAPLPRLLREIVEQGPVRPSSLLTADSGAPAPGPIPASRLRGDLDAVVLKALERSPERRYLSAASLAADLRRFLDGAPVTARPPGVVERVRRIGRRHPLATALSTLAAVVLVAFTAVTAALNLRLRETLERVEEERANAQRQRVEAERTADFLEDLFRSITPAQARGAEPTVPEVVRAGAARLLGTTEGFASAPSPVDVRLLLTLADVQTARSDFDGAELLTSRAEALSRRLGDPELVAASAGARARIHHARGEYGRAEELLVEALRDLDGTTATDERRARLLSDLGAARIGLQQYAEAEASLRSALESGNLSDRAAAVARLRLGTLLRQRGDLESARLELERAGAALERGVGSDHPDTISARKELADTLRLLGEHRAAIAVMESVLDDAERVYGAEHSLLAPVLDRLSLLHQADGAAAEAEALQRRALSIRERHFGPGSSRTTVSVNNLGWLLHDFGRLDEADELYRRALSAGESELGPEHPSVAVSLNNLGLLALDRGQPGEALEPLERALAILTRRLGPDHPSRGFPLTNLGIAWLELGESEAAAEPLDEALELRRRRLPQGHEDLAPTLAALGRLRCLRGEVAAGEALVAEAVAIQRARPAGVASFAVATAELELGACRLAAGDREGARALLASAIPRIEARRGAGDPRARRGRGLLAEVEGAAAAEAD